MALQKHSLNSTVDSSGGILRKGTRASGGGSGSGTGQRASIDEDSVRESIENAEIMAKMALESMNDTTLHPEQDSLTITIPGGGSATFTLEIDEALFELGFKSASTMIVFKVSDAVTSSNYHGGAYGGSAKDSSAKAFIKHNKEKGSSRDKSIIVPIFVADKEDGDTYKKLEKRKLGAKSVLEKMGNAVLIRSPGSARKLTLARGKSSSNILLRSPSSVENDDQFVSTF
jgi:hypothetical protein